ncbi:MAG: DUF2007 domain-containing protein [Pseudomonadota bacterium]
MKRFYQDYNTVKVYQVKQLLADAGIDCIVRNELIQGAAGEIPLNEALPEVWLVDGEWDKKAAQLLEKFEREQQQISDASEWTCSECNTINEADFGICWHCQSPRE